MGLNKNKEKFILFGGTVGIGIISLALTLAVYNVQILDLKNGNEKNINEINIEPKLTQAQKVVAENIITELNKIEKESKNKNENTNIEANEKSIEKNDKDGINEESITNYKSGEVISKEKINIKEDEVIETVAPIKKEIEFIKPVDGTLGMIFADEKLVYSQTLEEWVTHKAIDFIAPIGSNVKASADGIILNLEDDKKYGFTITIEHENGYVSKYSGVKENNLSVGKKIKQGDVLGSIDEVRGFESSEGSHLHFEVLKDGVNINPDFI